MFSVIALHRCDSVLPHPLITAPCQLAETIVRWKTVIGTEINRFPSCYKQECFPSLIFQDKPAVTKPFRKLQRKRTLALTQCEIKLKHSPENYKQSIFEAEVKYPVSCLLENGMITAFV